MSERRALLFLCVANSARSQMAEGLARAMLPPGWEVFSAGSSPAGVNPYAARAMAEVGVDLSSHRSKGIEAVPLERVHTAITLCAEEVCPVLPGGARRLHWPLPDPAATRGSDEEVMEAFRRVRDEIRRRLALLLAEPPFRDQS